jgi:hypothetical protein
MLSGQKVVWNAKLPALPTWHPAIIALNHDMGFPRLTIVLSQYLVSLPYQILGAKSDAMFSNCRTRHSPLTVDKSP